MLPLKFRFWDKELKKMLYRSLLPYDNEHKNIIVMQYLNIFDKNKKQYAFNDIVIDKYGIGVLVWLGDRLGIASGDIDNYNCIEEITEKELMNSEILGNIFENPDIINKTIHTVYYKIENNKFIAWFIGNDQNKTIFGPYPNLSKMKKSIMEYSKKTNIFFNLKKEIII